MRCVRLIDEAGSRCPEKAVRGYSLCVAHGAPAPAPPPTGPAEWTAEWIENEARLLLDHRDDDDDMETLLPGMMLIAALDGGPNADKIAKRLNASRAECRVIAARFRENGIWVGEVMNVGGWVEEDGHPIVFVLHALAGAGHVVAVGDDGEKWKAGNG